VRGT
jgi:hypothetical protein